MARKGPLPVFFDCVSIGQNGELIAESIEATSQTDASSIFDKKYCHIPKIILGPWFKKRAQVLESTIVLKFSNKTKKAIYNDWIVNAFLLEEPVDQAYLVFVKRIDGKKIPFPKGTITVPISDLRFM